MRNFISTIRKFVIDQHWSVTMTWWSQFVAYFCRAFSIWDVIPKTLTVDWMKLPNIEFVVYWLRHTLHSTFLQRLDTRGSSWRMPTTPRGCGTTRRHPRTRCGSSRRWSLRGTCRCQCGECNDASRCVLSSQSCLISCNIQGMAIKSVPLWYFSFCVFWLAFGYWNLLC